MYTQPLDLPLILPRAERARPPLPPSWIFALFLAFIVLLNNGCGASQRQSALAKTLLAVDTARVGFIAWDDAHQQDLVAKAPSYAEGAAALEAYRKQRAPVLLAFELAYQAIARAALEEGDTTFDLATKKLYQLLALIRGLAVASLTPDP